MGSEPRLGRLLPGGHCSDASRKSEEGLLKSRSATKRSESLLKDACLVNKTPAQGATKQSKMGDDANTYVMVGVGWVWNDVSLLSILEG